MVVMKDDDNKKSVSREEVDKSLDKVFNEISKAIQERDDNKIPLERVDETLDALFTAVNEAQQGKKAHIPDFKRILSGEY